MRQLNRAKAVILEEVGTGRSEVFHSFTEAGLKYGVSNQLFSRACRFEGVVLKRFRVKTGPRYYVVKTQQKRFAVCTYNPDQNRYEEITGLGTFPEDRVGGVRDITVCMYNKEEVNGTVQD